MRDIPGYAQRLAFLSAASRRAHSTKKKIYICQNPDCGRAFEAWIYQEKNGNGNKYHSRDCFWDHYRKKQLSDKS